MNEIIKVCKKHGELIENQCRKIIEKRWGNQPNYKYKCLQCIKVYNKTYLHKEDLDHQKRIKKLREHQKKKHHVKLLESKRRRQKLNRGKLNEQQKILRNKKLEHYRNIGKNIQKKWRENLDDNYVKSQIRQQYGFKSKDIPEGIVSFKKEIIRLRRKIKEIKNGN